MVRPLVRFGEELASEMLRAPPAQRMFYIDYAALKAQLEHIRKANVSRGAATSHEHHTKGNFRGTNVSLTNPDGIFKHYECGRSRL